MRTQLRWTFIVPGMPFLGDTLERESLGGSESAAIYLTRELSRLGDSVFCFTSAEKSGEWEGVNYLPLASHRDFIIANPHDVCVVQRAPQAFGTPIASKLNILWQHDMTLGRQRESFAGIMWNVDRVALLSDYMVKHYKSVHGLSDDMIFKTRNGICLSEFSSAKGLPRDPNKLMYTSRPERGLDVMLEKILPRLLERNPNYVLNVSGYDNKSHALGEMYGRIANLMAAHGDSVKWLGHLKHPELYEHYATAHLLCYPTPSPEHNVFDEISWISGMECQAAGLPVVTSNRGAIGETMAPGAGTLIDVPEGGCGEEDYINAFVDAVEAYRDTQTWNDASEAGLRSARHRETVAGDGYDWSNVAEQWHDEAVNSILIRNESSERLVRHFIKHDDIVAAKHVAKSAGQIMPPTVADSGKRPPQKAMDNWRTTLESQVDGKLNWLGDEPCRSIDPTTFLDNAEVGYDWVGFNVPYGPWHDGRTWEFDIHDIADMMAPKKEVTIQSAVVEMASDSADPLGLHFVAYKVEGSEPAAPINMERKLGLQRPRQTLSINIIAGGPTVAHTLGWCLESVKDIADEIVIADCGMHQDAIEIAKHYGPKVKIVSGKNPLEHGFETPRNQAIEASTCDWILWLDTDERLLNGHHLAKYLRTNCYAGYSLRQHHFAVDTDFSPDMPVRCFRRQGWNGKPIRFHGMIHEHPETGINEGPGPVIILPEVQIAHVGYLTEPVRQTRFKRNQPLLEMDKKRYPNRLLQKHFIMRDNSILMNMALQASGGVATEEVKALAEENRALYKEWMAGNNTYIHIDPSPYLAQALRILNKGIDVTFSIAAGRDGKDVPLNGSVATRFESEEDAIKEISHRVHLAMAPFQGDIW